jgi:methyltransferase (TIGR00027 family)
MQDGPSRTAITAALMRAIHTRIDQPRLIDDPWGDKLVAAEEKSALYQRIMAGTDADTRARLARLGSEQAVIDIALRRHRTYGGVIIRTRYAEDALARAVARGVRQYVLVGAGLDSFCVRQPPWARAISIVEIDHPASQAMKRDRLAACSAAVPPNVHFVAADLSREPLADVLARAPFSRTEPAFFTWLGVTIYLTREANLATLKGVARAAAIGTELVFTYVDQRVFDGQFAEFEKVRSGPAAVGEPWLSGFDPRLLAAELIRVGLVLREDLNGTEQHARYCAGRSDGLSPGSVGHVARAVVAGYGSAPPVT